MFYLIFKDKVYDIKDKPYSVNKNDGLFWIEREDGLAEINDYFINENFQLRQSLDDLKKMKIIELEQIRNEVMVSNIIVDNHEYFADDKSILLLHQCITMEGLGIQSIFPRDWILADGSLLKVSFDDIKALAVAISGRKDRAYGNYIALMTTINAAQDKESLNKIDINQGWIS